jgi:hypothetical protein
LKKLILGACLIALPLAGAQAMNVADFLGKADALQKKGMMALFSGGDIKALKAEIVGNGAALHKERMANKAAGRPQGYCPPEKSSLNSNEILAAFHTIPPAQRSSVQVKDALRALLTRKYPCRS